MKRPTVTAGAATLSMLLACAACGSDEPEPEPSAEVDSVIDECLLGTWKTASQRQELTIEDVPVAVIDTPRTLEFTADGREVVTYLPGPSDVQDQAGKTLGTVTNEGKVVYRVSTDKEGTISFVVEEGQVSSTLDLGGAPQTSTFDGTSDPVEYTCSDDTLTQKSDGYAAEFERS